jgi:hypothetical protein
VPSDARHGRRGDGRAVGDDDPDATQAIPWLPDVRRAGRSRRRACARSPLLARAFQGTDRQR